MRHRDLGQISRTSNLLDFQLRQFRNRHFGQLSSSRRDAHYEKIRRQGRIQDVVHVLKRTGVNCWGKREVIGPISDSGLSERRSTGRVSAAVSRGLEGVQLIVPMTTQDYELPETVFPSVPWQRCQFHLSQNAQRYDRGIRSVPPSPRLRDIFI